MGAPMEPMRLPTAEDLSAGRVERFRARVAESLEAKDLPFFEELVESMLAEQDGESEGEGEE
mgnify:FL=1